MNTKLKNVFLGVAILPLFFLTTASPCAAQDKTDAVLPVRPIHPKPAAGRGVQDGEVKIPAVPPIRIPRFGGPGMQMIQMGGTGGTRFSQRSQNGNIVSTLVQGGETFILEETPDGIFISVNRSYNTSQIEELKKDHPDVAKAMASFPTDSNGQPVVLSVRLTKRFEALDEEELKTDSPEGFKIFKKIKSFGGGRRMGFGGIGFPGLKMDMRGAAFPKVIPMEIDRMFEGLEMMDDIPRIRRELKRLRPKDLKPKAKKAAKNRLVT